MKVIGVTGGVGAGKSEILNYIADNWNATVVEADEVGYLVMKPGKSCFAPIVELFGPGILQEDGTLDRTRIAQMVFEDKNLLEKLNAIVHPAVKKYIRKAIQREEENETDFFIVEAALLIEDKYDEICDELWYIYADEETRTERLKKNRGYSEEKIKSIFANQLSEDEFSEHCDFEIDNSGDFEDTKEQIMQRMQMYETM
ncbi:dephospho-CoA kinase [bacterium]|nr:dephospho-CoA kinase [bacterium]MCI6430410.1 dephospho-CoA kinase [Lachnospiraceae bacterium]MDY3021565.1 dephospho-CoA kinase [Oliverpabstia sp.]MDY5027166.1 dephospho-CoA kinase [Oliverpabstia sp.]